MELTQSKSTHLYEHIRGSLRAGSYLPGQRLDPAMLAAEFRTSPTPVRFALYRLVGEGLLTDQGRAGLQVPLLTELALRDLYDWMHRLLLIACELGISPVARSRGTPTPANEDLDVVQLTWRLFDDIACSAAHGPLCKAARQANDSLSPIRKAKQGLLQDPKPEIQQLHAHWRNQEMTALCMALTEYHQRRKKLVPCIVETLNEQRGKFP